MNISLVRKAFLLLTCLTFVSACSSITIKEESFLRDRQHSTLYQLIRYEGSTKDEVSERTYYSVEEIDKSLIKLQKKGFVEYRSGGWWITEKYRKEEPDYTTSIEKFRIQDIQSGLSEHDFSLKRIDNDRIQVAAYLSNSPKETLVIFPGNGFNIVPDILEVKKFLAPHRNVFVMDYPGMGDSQGRLTIESLRASAKSFIDYVAVQDSVKNTKLIIYGFSLGGFVATEIASQLELDALILDSTAPDMQSWVDANVPLYAKAIVNVEVDEKLKSVSNLGVISTIGCPILFIVGADDEITPPALMSKLESSAKNSKYTEMVILEGVSHGESLDHSKFKTTIGTFIHNASN